MKRSIPTGSHGAGNPPDIYASPTQRPPRRGSSRQPIAITPSSPVANGDVRGVSISPPPAAHGQRTPL